MPRTVEELRADVDELKRLSELATRQSIKDLLLIETRRVETEISKQLAESISNVEIKPSVPSSVNKCYDVNITNYAWDQSDKFFKIFVTLNNVQTLPSDNVTCQFSERSVELAVKNLEGKNHNLLIKNLAETIDQAKSYWKVKSDMIVIFLAKQRQSVKWDAVTLDEKRIKEAKASKLDSKSDDPQASMMNLMKQLYEDGDDEMKRTIAKAFVESRNKSSDIGL